MVLERFATFGFIFLGETLVSKISGSKDKFF